MFFVFAVREVVCNATTYNAKYTYLKSVDLEIANIIDVEQALKNLEGEDCQPIEKVVNSERL